MGVLGLAGICGCVGFGCFWVLFRGFWAFLRISGLCVVGGDLTVLGVSGSGLCLAFLLG